MSHSLKTTSYLSHFFFYLSTTSTARWPRRELWFADPTTSTRSPRRALVFLVPRKPTKAGEKNSRDNLKKLMTTNLKWMLSVCQEICSISLILLFSHCVRPLFHSFSPNSQTFLNYSQLTILLHISLRKPAIRGDPPCVLTTSTNLPLSILYYLSFYCLRIVCPLD